MKTKPEEIRDILRTLAVHQAADESELGAQHASRVAKLQVNSWQAEIIRNAQEIKSANDAQELRSLMEDRDAAVIFLPQSAPITAEIIDRICAESPFDKMIIWETNA